jgi:hypothetical protein
MPLLSRFTPLGMLSLSSAPSHAETIFDALVRSQGDAYAAGGPHEAKLYAQAMGLARGQYALERAGNQQFPKRATDLFDILEREHGLVPRADDSTAERTAELSARMLLPGGAAQSNVERTLSELLGEDFVAYRPTPTDEMVLYPDNIGDSPMNLQAPEVVRKRLVITDAISTGLGAPQQVQYLETRTEAEDTALLAAEGDVLVVGPGTATEERVTVTAIATVDGDHFLAATFEQPHPPETLAITAPYPMWMSTKRHSLIVLTAAAASDAEKRRKVHDLMRRIARGVSTWDIAGESDPGETGPFILDESLMDQTPFEAITL